MQRLNLGSTFVDNAFLIIGNVDPTKKLNVQVDTQATASQLTIDVGAQTAGRTLTVPVMTANRTLAITGQDNAFTSVQTITPASGGIGLNIVGAAATLGSSPDLRLKYVSDADAAFSFLAYDHNNISLAYDAYFNGTNWIASATSSVLLSKGSGQLSFFVNVGLTKGNTHPATNFAMALKDATVTASNSLTGVLVVGDQATAATNVAIGGGTIYAGTSIVCKAATGTSNFTADTTSGAAQCGYRWSDNGTVKWIVDKAPDQNLYVFDGVNSVNMVQFVPGAVAAGRVAFLNTTTSSSSITGALVIGDGSTVASNVGIGAGKVFAGSQFYVKVTGTANGAVTIDSTAGATQVGMTFRDNAVDQWIMYKPGANATLRFFDAVNAQDMLILTQGTASTGTSRFANVTASSSSITGALIVGDGATAATNVGIGGGKIFAGSACTIANTGGTTATLTLNATTASTNAGLSFADAGTANFSIYKTTTNILSIADTVNSVDMLVFSKGAVAAGFAHFQNSTTSTSTGTGAVVIDGGLGVAGQITFDGSTAKSLRVTNAAANAAVAVTFGSVGPTGSTAGNAQGWLRISVAGTDRFIPFW